MIHGNDMEIVKVQGLPTEPRFAPVHVEIMPKRRKSEKTSKGNPFIMLLII